MAIFNSYVSLPEGIYVNNVHNCSYGRHPKLKDSCPPRWVVTTIPWLWAISDPAQQPELSKSVTCCEMVWTAWLQLWRAGMALYGPVDRVFKGFVWTPSGNMSRKSRCIQMLHPKGRKPPWLKASVAGWDELRSPETFLGAMGHSASTDLPHGSESPSPSSLLWVKVRAGSKVQTPTTLNGDNILKICRWLQGKPHSWRMYVTISVGRGQGQTEIAHVQGEGFKHNYLYSYILYYHIYHILKIKALHCKAYIICHSLKMY